MSAEMMPTDELDSGYDAFAWFFNKYWSRDIPEQMLSAIEQVLLPRLPDRARLLDLCCGTGQLASALTTRGYNVTGVDSSPKMLDFARRNAPAAEFVQADARRFHLPDSFDAVVSTFDSLNHFLSLEELGAVFRQTRRALAPAGWFFFDMNVERGFLAHWRDYFAVVEESEVCVLRGEYDTERKLGRYDITMFRQRGRMWQRADTTILERCYEQKEIERELKQAGFGEMLAFDAVKNLGLTDHTGRIFFLTRC
ncbi:MAG TPA: class I SAM-dependent methyltransferase [Pyrinomonadaceae bacterium]|jgi:SAM-dependent methyltransferase